MSSEPGLVEFETSVIRGIQAGITSCRARGEVSPHLVALLHAGLTRLLAGHGRLEIRCAGHFLALNDQRFPRGDQDRVSARRLVRLLRHCGLVGLRIEPGLSAAELRAALEVLGRSSLPGELQSEVHARLHRAGVKRLTALASECGPALSFPGGFGFTLHRALAQKLYLQALRLYREAGDDLSQRRPLRIHDIRRLLQRTVDLMDEDDAPLLGLSSIKSLQSYELTHAVNVTILSLGLARAAGLPHRVVEDIGLGAFLHDVGQMDVSAAVLSRAGALSESEWASMRRHTLHGAARLLEAAPLGFAAPAALAALEHHLGLSADGYPTAPAGYETSLVGRIVHIADTYDALTSRRVYRRRSLLPDRVLAFMLENAGRRFDPLLVKLFVRMLGLFPPGTTVQLDTGEVGVVVRPSRRARLLHRPEVCLFLDAQGRPVEKDPIVDLTATLPGSAGFLRSVSRTLYPEPLEIAPAAVFLSLG